MADENIDGSDDYYELVIECGTSFAVNKNGDKIDLNEHDKVIAELNRERKICAVFAVGHTILHQACDILGEGGRSTLGYRILTKIGTIYKNFMLPKLIEAKWDKNHIRYLDLDALHTLVEAAKPVAGGTVIIGQGKKGNEPSVN